MEQFSLEKWLENPSRKIVTRQGKSVRIICTDRRHTDSWPIVALEDYGDGEFVIYANIDGRTDMCSENIHDLFFADEEDGLTEFEKAVQNILNEPHFQDIEAVKQFSKTLLDLARKELLKDLPKWKKAHEHKEFPLHECVMDEDMVPFLDTEVNEGDYYIELDNLKILPKEE